MADKKISELVSADALSGAELIETVQGGVNKRTTAQDIANLAPGAGHVIEDEGTPLTARTKLNFVGAGVTVTDDAGNDATVITIDAGTTLFAGLTDDPRDNAALEAELEALEAADDTKANLAIEIRSITGSHTLDATDASNFTSGKSMHIKGDGAGTLTIPLQSVQAMPAGYNVMYSGFTAVVEGNVSITTNPSSGSLTSSSTTAKYYLIRNGSDDWDVENGAPAGSVKQDALITIKTKTASHTLDSDDLADVNAGKSILFNMNVATANALTIPANSAQAFPLGTVVFIDWVGAGQPTITPDTGVTFQGGRYKISEQYEGCFAKKVATDTWRIQGSLIV